MSAGRIGSRSGWTWLALASVASVASVAILGVARIARAEDLPSVTLTASGPDRDLPVGKSFYVAGTAGATIQSEQAVVVRKGSPLAIGGSAGPGCLDLRTRMGAFRPTPPGAAIKATAGDLDADYLPLAAGSRTARSIWVHGEGAALVTAVWKRGALTGDQPFKLLVPGDGEFFRAGYSYCLFVFTVNSVKDSVEAKVKEAFARHDAALERCQVQDQACAQATAAALRQCQADPRAVCDPAAAAATLQCRQATQKCEQEAIDALKLALAATGVPESARLLHAATELKDQPGALRYMLETWRRASDPTASAAPTFLKRVELPLFIPLVSAPHPGGHAPLASYLANLLVRRDGLFVQLAGGGLRYHTIDGKTRIKHLGLRDDGKLDGAAEDSPAHAIPLALTLDALALPDATITARDLVEATQGRLEPPRYRSLKATLAELEDALRAEYGAGAGKLASLRTLRDRVGGLAEAMRRAFAASQGYRCASHDYAPGLAPPATLEQGLGEWLRCAVVLDSCAAVSADWAAHGIAVPPACGANPRAWPGYADLGATPLDAIEVAAAELLDAHAAWAEARDALVKASSKTTEVTTEAKIGFTQETWVGSYLTPVVGYAHIPFADATLLYAAVQLHAVPNPVDDPQWSHGWADLARAFAVEIGFATGAGSFGPDGRFDGPWRLPPVFLGLAFHPVPYTSISGGVVLADVRTTTLTQQDRHVEGFGFVGFSLQGNLPDLLYKKLGYGLQTTVDK